MQMLFILIPTVWLSLILFVVVACRAAARGDRMLTQVSREAAREQQRLRWQDGPGRTGTQRLRAHEAARAVGAMRLRGGHGF